MDAPPAKAERRSISAPLRFSSSRGSGVHHRVELRDTAVQIPHVSPGQRDRLCERCGVTIDGFLCRD
jgi:hypothetical protein